MTDALILAGGVAKGAFAAGALTVLLGSEGKSRARVDVHSIVAASSGALNGAFAASLLHAGTEEVEVHRLVSMWQDEASFGRIFDPGFRSAFRMAGASGEEKVLALLKRAIVPAPKARTIELRLVVASLAGSVGMLGGAPATSYERVFTFDATTFESEPALDAMFKVVTASAAFPGAFVPVPLEIDGELVPCIDGGAVNNAPLRYALDHPFGIDRVFVVSPQPRVITGVPRDLKGLGLLSHLAEMLVEERLYRDLCDGYRVNTMLERLAKAVPDEATRAAVLESLGWTDRKPIEIIEIRPPEALRGGMFDGFFHRDLRDEYLGAGEAAARAWLAKR